MLTLTAIATRHKGMTVVFTFVLVVHGLIHVLGFVKAFGLAELPQLTQPVSPSLGVLWLLAALLFLAAAAALFVWPRGWWAIGACAIVVSMFVIVPSWTDAKFGAIGNLVALTGVIFGFLAQGPVSLRAAYERDVHRTLAHVAPAEPVSDEDLARLPAPVQRYLRGAGVRRTAARPQLPRSDARAHPEQPRCPVDAAPGRAVQRRR